MYSQAEISRLKAHIRRLIDQSSYRGRIDKLSVALGRSDAWLRGFLSNKAVPRADILLPLARELHCSVDFLLNPDFRTETDPVAIADSVADEVKALVMQRLTGTQPEPTSDDIKKWWLANGGRLECLGFLDERFDLFEPPDGSHRQLIPYKIGANALSARSLDSTSHDVFSRTVSPLPETYRDLILKAHKSSLECGPISTIETLDAIHPDSGVAIKLEYIRTLCPTKTSDGKTLILNYSKLLRKSGEVTGNIDQVSPA